MRRVTQWGSFHSLPCDILAVPTVVRVTPKPERRVVGDLSLNDKAAEWLGLTEAKLHGDNTAGHTHHRH